MSFDLSGRNICITGATHGIGLAIATACAKAGAALVINSHVEDEAAQEALATLSAMTETHFVLADLAAPGGAERLIDRARMRLGTLHTLINNAGTFLDKPFGTLTEEIFDRTFALNVRAQIFATQSFAAQAEPGADPSVICIGSTNSMAAEPNSVIYDASKGAVLMAVRSMAVSLASKGVRVNGIGPGLVDTPLTAKGLQKPGARAAAEKGIPIGRIAQPDDIGGTAVFLSSAAARYITGQMIFVDGGILANQVAR